MPNLLENMCDIHKYGVYINHKKTYEDSNRIIQLFIDYIEHLFGSSFSIFK